MQTLIFASMPDGADPRTHLAAGAWCFSGREEAFPGWDDASRPDAFFPLPPDPYPDGGSILKAAREANGAALKLFPTLAASVGLQTGEAFPSREFLQTAFGPYTLLACHMLAERQQRLLDLVHTHGSTALRVPLLPEDIPFSFANSVDFMIHGVQDVVFNHYVYSRIIESVAPPSWQKEYLPSVSLHMAAQSSRKTMKSVLRNLLRSLPFPRLKGFSLFQALLFSLAVLTNKNERTDQSLDFSTYCDAPVTWLFPAEQLILKCIPVSLSQALSRLSASQATSPPSCSGRRPLRVISPSFTQDDDYRVRLALYRHKGCRLVSVQHGANYGNLKSIGGIALEYCQHAFISWGWTEHENSPVNTIPLPHPMLCRIAGTHRETAPRLILVGSEMSTFSYRLKSRPQAGSLPAYRASKVRFLEIMAKHFALLCADKNTEAAPELSYRPYFKVAGGLDDAAYVKRHLPGVSLCNGDLTRQMLACRLLVLDHYGTTLHMALAADVPCLAFWNDKDWAMEAGSRELLCVLRSVGILHETAEAAADKAMEIWAEPENWWKSEAVRDARQRWLEFYANIGGITVPTMTELNARWWKTLRAL